MADTFLNPYNFIALPEHKAKAYGDTDKHTGVIEYTITTHSPLFIPNTSSENAFNDNGNEHKTFDFYSYNELDKNKNYKDEYFEPVIPGSELRGMIRGIYETLTDSCMGVLNQSTHPVMRVGARYDSGLIKRENAGKFVLYKAQSFRSAVKKSKNILYGAWSEELTKTKKIKEGCYIEGGYVIKGEKGPEMDRGEKCRYHIFKLQNKIVKDLVADDIEGLKAVLKSYQTQSGASESYKEYTSELEKFLKGDKNSNEYFPVYYSKLDNYLYLAPACITRERAKHTLGDLAGEFIPCVKIKEKCPACDLFGMIGSSNTEAVASKVRFSDAKVEKREKNEQYYEPIVTLEPLGQPRINNVEFYLKCPGETINFWNYDYYVDGKGNVQLYDAQLRGRKYYWHQNNKKLRKDVIGNDLNKSVRPVKSGITFKGKLFYEGISQKQLEQLMWILNGGQIEEQLPEGPIAYKLGMGKPLGLGSVSLKVEKCSERALAIESGTINYNIQECEMTSLNYDEIGFSPSAKSAFFTICSLNAAGNELVSYPITKKQYEEKYKKMGAPNSAKEDEKKGDEGFKWYVDNHGSGMQTSRKQLRRLSYLPAIDGKNEKGAVMKIKLPVLSMVFGSNSEKNQNTKPRKENAQRQEREVNKGSKIECVLTTPPRADNRGKGYLANIKYNGKSGMIFKVPQSLKKGERVMMKITNLEKMYGEYAKN